MSNPFNRPPAQTGNVPHSNPNIQDDFAAFMQQRTAQLDPVTAQYVDAEKAEQEFRQNQAFGRGLDPDVRALRYFEERAEDDKLKAVCDDICDALTEKNIQPDVIFVGPPEEKTGINRFLPRPVPVDPSKGKPAWLLSSAWIKPTFGDTVRTFTYLVKGEGIVTGSGDKLPGHNVSRLPGEHAAEHGKPSEIPAGIEHMTVSKITDKKTQHATRDHILVPKTQFTPEERKQAEMQLQRLTRSKGL